LAIAAVVTLVNPNDFKGTISQKVYQKTGQQLIIGGDISWSFYPGFGIKIDDVRVRNLVSVGEIKANVQLLPLLHGKIKARKLIFKKLKLYPKNKLAPTIKMQTLAVHDLRLSSKDTAILKNLNGSGKVLIKNGMLQGINIPYILRTADSLIYKKPLPQKTSNATNFGNLTASFTIKNGILTNKDLFMDAPEFQATGQGIANLINQQLNYHIKATKIKEDQTKPLLVPIKITGTFSNPKYRPDINYAVKQAGQKVVEQIISGKDIKDVGKEITKDIGGLFR
jgi:uncharacterized protein involved in outer membrane biogenesis